MYKKNEKVHKAENMEQESIVKIERIDADPEQGLTKEQIRERFEQHADNFKVESSTLSVSEIVKSNVFTYFNLVFFIIAVFSF